VRRTAAAARAGPLQRALRPAPCELRSAAQDRLSPELGDTVAAANRAQPRPFAFDRSFDAPGHPLQLYCRSDHAMYARHGIPVAAVSTGMHGDYHQVTDEPQYLDHDKLARVTRLVADVTRRVGDMSRRPTVVGARPDPRAPCAQ
jgi:hypothetical protein